MKAKQFFLLCFLLAGKISYSQLVYNMPATGTQTDTVCGGIFYDSGGPAANYANSANGILVFYPAIAGQFVMMTFTSIGLGDATDRLRIFSGTDTTTVPLFNVAGPTSSAGCGATLVSTDSACGCLTVHFQSGSTFNASGWRALLYCNPTISIIPPGTNCANPVSISSIPFTDSNQCTECMLNDYQTQSGICNVGYAGEDKVYRYTATGPETVCITTYNATGNTTLAIYSGCPGAGGFCITPTPMVGNDSLQITFPGAGTYYIIVDATSGFSCYSLDIVSCIVGINENKNPKDGVLIFPNPAANELRIENADLRIKVIEFYNTIGKKVFQFQNPGLKSQISVDISKLPSGIYFIRMTDADNKSVTGKFVRM